MTPADPIPALREMARRLLMSARAHVAIARERSEYRGISLLSAHYHLATAAEEATEARAILRAVVELRRRRAIGRELERRDNIYRRICELAGIGPEDE